MLVIAPKDNLVRTSPSRVTVVIEPSRGGAVVDFIFIRGSCRQEKNIAPGSADQVTERWRQNRVERSADMAARSTLIFVVLLLLGLMAVRRV